MTFCILDRLGLVHSTDRVDHCRPLRMTAVKHEVTPLQCHVFGLPPCGVCFPSDRAYKLLIGSSMKARAA